MKLKCINATDSWWLKNGETYEVTPATQDGYDDASGKAGKASELYSVQAVLGNNPGSGVYFRSRFEPEQKPTFADGTRVTYSAENLPYVYIITGTKFQHGKEYVSIQGTDKQSYFSHTTFDLFEARQFKALPQGQAGDRVELSITAEIVKVEPDGGYVLRTDKSGRFAIDAADINGTAKILKARPKPWTTDAMATRGGKTWSVKTKIDDDWAVLTDGTNNYKLVHRNEPAFVRTR